MEISKNLNSPYILMPLESSRHFTAGFDCSLRKQCFFSHFSHPVTLPMAVFNSFFSLFLLLMKVFIFWREVCAR